MLRVAIIGKSDGAYMAAHRHDRLVAEQQLRAVMPASDRAAEQTIRVRWHTDRAFRQAIDQRIQQRQRRQADPQRPLRPTPHRGLGRGRNGPSLGR